MLSNLASYLLGYAEPSVPAPVEDDIRLTAIETDDDDWIVIEKSDEKENELGPGSRRSSSASLPCLSMEESWFITPPPCFTSTGPVLVETSPMENLLIEHPSMSVYHRHRAFHMGPERPPQPQREEDPATEASAPTSRSTSPAPRALRRPNTNRHRHHTLASAEATQHYLQVQLLTAQKVQNYKTSQGLKRNQLERVNKTREVNNRNKRHCRKDKQKNHSGANNNRKCC